MIYEQREAPPKAKRRPTDELWKPEKLPEEIVPEEGDGYVVIDDLADGRVVLTSAPWPHLDGVGRLTFLDEPEDLHMRVDDDESRLQEVLNTKRGAFAKTLEDLAVIERPLRIGDTFLVRGLSEDPTAWDSVVDVTSQARLAAKTALYAAVAPRVTEERAEELGLTAQPKPREDHPPTVSGSGAASPAV